METIKIKAQISGLVEPDATIELSGLSKEDSDTLEAQMFNTPARELLFEIESDQTTIVQGWVSKVYSSDAEAYFAQICISAVPETV